MIAIEPLLPDNYARMPWKNGRGALVVIDREGAESWQTGVAWQFGRTAIVEAGPFSDFTGYERLQVVIAGAGLVLVAPDHEIDLRTPLTVQRYDGGLPVRTRLENGPVEVVNLIADRRRFDIALSVARAGDTLACPAGRHILYAPTAATEIAVAGNTHTLAPDHALRLTTDESTYARVLAGTLLLGSIVAKG